MDIIIEDDKIKKTPFSYANIYEKQKIEDNLFNKYYNIKLINQRVSGKLIEYITIILGGIYYTSYLCKYT